MDTTINSFFGRIAVSRARSFLAYLFDMWLQHNLKVRETLNNSDAVIASVAKQSRITFESKVLDRHAPVGLAMTGLISAFLVYAQQAAMQRVVSSLTARLLALHFTKVNF